MAEGNQQNRQQQNAQQNPQQNPAGVGQGNERPEGNRAQGSQQSGQNFQYGQQTGVQYQPSQRGNWGEQGQQDRYQGQRGGYGSTGYRQQSAQYGSPNQQSGGYGQRGGQHQQQQFASGGQFQNIAEVALRGTALLFDLQLEAARNAWETQARGAAMLGAPDFSNLFRIGDDRARRVFSASTEQMVNTMRRTADTVIAVQQEIGRLAEQQTIGMTDQMRQQIEQLGQQTQRGLEEIQQMSVDQLNQATEATGQMYDDANDAQRQQFAQQGPERGERDAQFSRGNGGQNGGEATPHAEHQNALERDQQHRDQQRIITPGNEQRGAEGERARAKRT